MTYTLSIKDNFTQQVIAMARFNDAVNPRTARDYVLDDFVRAHGNYDITMIFTVPEARYEP